MSVIIRLSKQKTFDNSNLETDNMNNSARPTNDQIHPTDEEIRKRYPFADFSDNGKGTKGRRRSKDIVIIEKRDDSIEKKIKVIDVKRREEKREKENISKRKASEDNGEPIAAPCEPIYASINKNKTLEKGKTKNFLSMFSILQCGFIPY